MPTRFDDEHDEFLQKLNAQLRRMPQADRAEIHVEVRQHLDDLAKAHEELGATTDEAERAALHQFGDPVKIGRRLFDEWRRTPQTSLWRIAGWAYLRLCVPQSCVSAVGLIWVYHTSLISPLIGLPALLSFYLLPAFVGAKAASLFGRRAVPALAVMSTASFGISLVLGCFLTRFWTAFPPPSHVSLISGASFRALWSPFLLLTSAWLAQRFDGSPRLSLASIKSRFRR